MGKNAFLYAFAGFRRILTPGQKKKGRNTLFLITLISLADVVGLAAVVPILMLAIDGDFLAKSRKLRSIYQMTGFSNEGSFLVFLIIAVALFFIIKNLLALLLQEHVKKMATSLVEDITARRFHAVLLNDYATMTAKGNPNLLNQVHFMPFHYCTGVVLPFVNIVAETVVVVCILIFFTLYNPTIFLLIGIIIGPAFYIIHKTVKNKIYELGKETKSLREATLSMINLGVNGLIDIKLNNTSEYFLSRFLSKQRQLVASDFKAINYQNIPSRANEFVVLTGVIILVVYGYFFSTNPGELRVIGAMFVLAVFRLIPAINRLLVAAMKLKMYQHTIEGLETNAPQTSVPAKPMVFNHSIELKNLSYSFNGGNTELYHNLSLFVAKGDTVGIIGESGSGKSTLIRIISGLIQNHKGQVLIDGQELTPEYIESWQHQLGFVSQSPFLFNATVLENITFGDHTPDIARVQEVLKMAGLTDFATADNLHLHIGENGAKISEGQKQRLAIARALYKNAQVLILDEATSALDQDTEKQILETIKNLSDHKITIIIIAHKLSILSVCQVIYELKDGTLKRTYADR